MHARFNFYEKFYGNPAKNLLNSHAYHHSGSAKGMYILGQEEDSLKVHQPRKESAAHFAAAKKQTQQAA